ncbi:MAG: multiheme c-type cytochrome [Candidatus Zixiibacteriota bacterium]
MRRLMAVALALGVMLAFGGAVWAADSTKVAGKPDTLKWAEAHFKYVGETKCKMCHKQQYDSWATTPHAKAWAALKPEEQKKAECVECHITGKTASDSVLINVGCEACHGPGSDYKAMNKMKDPKLAAAAGLLPVSEAMCVRCHNAKSPTFKSFDFAKAKETGVHKHFPKKEPAAAPK